MKRFFNALCVLLLLSSCLVKAQTRADPELLVEINKIKAVDNHAHPLQVVAEGETDTEEAFSAPPQPMDVPVRLRPDSPEYVAAWRALYGYRHDDMSVAHLRELAEATAVVIRMRPDAGSLPSCSPRTSVKRGIWRKSHANEPRCKRRVRRERGESYPAWVLDRLGIEVMLANRVAMGRGLTPPRFLWVPFADPLMYPLDNTGAGSANPDARKEYEGAERILKRYTSELRVGSLPPTLDGYLSRVVTPTLERQKKDGAVALKFATAYLRPLDFANVPERRARNVYARYVRGGEPPAVEYKALQDFLFRYIAREAGRLGLVVHIHVGAGASGYFNQTGANPFLLESVLNDPGLRKTNFVLVHGGLPNARETRFLLYKPNVYADFSGQTFLLSTRELSEVLRSWLEFVPEKVLFGTDAFIITPEVGWEDLGWLTTTSAREALAIALTGMMQDGQLTREQAVGLARLVLRENANRLYGLNR